MKSSIAADDAAKLAAYLEYLAYEKANGEPPRVHVLYERAVSDLALVPEIWVSYCHYLVRKQ